MARFLKRLAAHTRISLFQTSSLPIMILVRITHTFTEHVLSPLFKDLIVLGVDFCSRRDTRSNSAGSNPSSLSGYHA
jgi:hypothetical protein